ncbi:MAG: T3SS effector HopA1 family protein, partial [Dolichospermum sp.]
ILRIEPDGSLAVKKDGLTIYIEPECHLKSPRKSSKIGDLISIWMPKNRLQNGCYVAVSNLGMAKPDGQNNDLGVGLIYFNFTSAGAIIFMESLTQSLNNAAIFFSFNVLSNPGFYGRYDAGVLHFARQKYPTIKTILPEIYQKYHAYFQPEI